ncbi:MAG: glycosyltransferase family 4 protein [Salinivirgaceae bacterium]|nr:glycosyltransferase family 4 protein [Salinivirgaceae bacterium]
MNKLKILSIAPEPLCPPISGDQKGVFGYLNALGQISQLTVITGVGSTIPECSFELRPIVPRSAFRRISRANYKIIYDQVIELKPDVIILEQPVLGWMGTLSKKTGVPVFIHSINIEYLRSMATGKWWWPAMFEWERFAMKMAKGAFFTTDQDRQIAINKFNLSPEKCFLKPYGIEQTSLPAANSDERAEVRKKHGIDPNDKVFMFFGVLKYLPSIESLSIIIDEISPRLHKLLGSGYKILICGGGLSKEYQNRFNDLKKNNIVYAGFVEDINAYIRSSDVIMNPALQSGGIKSKVIEAIGQNRPVVSTSLGAIGIDTTVCGNKLQVVVDNNWDMFSNSLVNALSLTGDTPQAFFDKYSWNGIAKNVYDTLHTTVKKNK